MKSKEVVERIKNLILTERLNVGDRLPTERSLAERFGVSRIIVREAISYLKAIGIVESRQGSGNYVIRLPDGSEPFYDNGSIEYDLDELINAREFMEVAIATFFTENFTRQMLEDMEYALHSMEVNFHQGKILDVVEADVMFHHIYAQACGNTILYDFLDRLTNYMKSKIWLVLKRDYLWDHGYQQQSIENHKRVFQALLRRDRDMLIESIKQHYDAIREHLEL
ncbi:MAG: GntR family transcriptional regulator, transcriptional repressor for pyruvate dehydrogenase complex [Thermotogota bacterium]|nr:GntR family transcriptional regulator, transcriptional repressor for pyruvate dehydrogenase complex [Thermotogota bacterium]